MTLFENNYLYFNWKRLDVYTTQHEHECLGNIRLALVGFYFFSGAE